MFKSPLKSAEELKVVFSGTERQILLVEKCAEDYLQAIEGNDQISVKRRIHLTRSFDRYCHTKDHRLPEEKFKREGKFPDGNGTNVAVYVFKGWQYRIYGSEIVVKGIQSFVGVKTDPSKKGRKADQELLKETAKIVGRLKEYKE